MTVELITAATPEIHEAMGRLIPQLSRSVAGHLRDPHGRARVD